MEPAVETAASASENLHGTVTIAELDLADQRQSSGPEEECESKTNGIDVSDTQPTPLLPPRPQVKLMSPDRPVRYIPIHVW